MSELRELQRGFQRHVLRPGRAFERRIDAAPRAHAARRLSIYAHAYRARLVEALGADYVVLATLLGERHFERLVLDFVRAHPSRQPNLRWYGAGLAAFLARAEAWRLRPRLAELARFEWALGLAFDAADAPTIGAQDIARVTATDWPGLRFRLHPSVQRVALVTNAPNLWGAVKDKLELPRSRRRRPLTWLVWRRELTPAYRALDAGEALALAALARGKSFAEICAAVRRFAGTASAPLVCAQYLRNWSDEGLLAEIVAAR